MAMTPQADCFVLGKLVAKSPVDCKVVAVSPLEWLLFTRQPGSFVPGIEVASSSVKSRQNIFSKKNWLSTSRKKLLDA